MSPGWNLFNSQDSRIASQARISTGRQRAEPLLLDYPHAATGSPDPAAVLRLDGAALAGGLGSLDRALVEHVLEACLVQLLALDGDGPLCRRQDPRRCPNARWVMDPFHVVQWMNDALDAVRCEERCRLG